MQTKSIIDTATPQGDRAVLPSGDYVSPHLEIVRLDDAFPNMIVGRPALSQWPYLRREISHNWYVDRRNPTVGFLSRDEISILYNSARRFPGLPCLEIGCWRGWSTAHFALGAGSLEVVDPILHDPVFREDVAGSLLRAGVLDRVVLHDGYSPEEVERISAHTSKRWSMVFIDGDHEGDAPRLDAETATRYAADDALVLFHDLASPDVSAGLEYLRSQGWSTAVYQTMQIMGVAVRGAAKPVAHVPDPTQVWTLPDHLASFRVIGESRFTRLKRVTALLAGSASPHASKRGPYNIDTLPEDEATILDSLLDEAGAVATHLGPGGLISSNEATRAFDELHRQHVGLLEKLERLDQTHPDTDGFDLLQKKHLDLVCRLGEAELARDHINCELTAAQGAEAAAAEELRNVIHERDASGRLLDRALTRLEQTVTKCTDLERAKASAEFNRAQTFAALQEIRAAWHCNLQSRDSDGAIRCFSGWIARKRVLFGLTRRLLTGRCALVRSLIEQSLRAHGVPERAADATVGWLSRPRVILGLSRRRAFAGADAVQALVVQIFERVVPPTITSLPPISVPAPDDTELRQLRETVVDLQRQLEAERRRFQALEEAKLDDERALLQAQLAIATLRGPVVASAS